MKSSRHQGSLHCILLTAKEINEILGRLFENHLIKLEIIEKHSPLKEIIALLIISLPLIHSNLIIPSLEMGEGLRVDVFSLW
jgi:hypothetical protein